MTDSTTTAPATAKTATRKPAPKTSAATKAEAAREREIADYAAKGATTYTERRLLDITESVQRTQAWVALMSILVLVFGAIAVITLMANA